MRGPRCVRSGARPSVSRSPAGRWRRCLRGRRRCRRLRCRRSAVPGRTASWWAGSTASRSASATASRWASTASARACCSATRASTASATGSSVGGGVVVGGTPAPRFGVEVEVGAGAAAERARGVVGPHPGGVAAAVDAAAAPDALERDLGALADLVVRRGRLAEHADRGDQLGRVAHEPGRLVVVGGAGLARGLVVGVLHGVRGGAVVDHARQDGGEGVGGLAAQDLLADRVGQRLLLVGAVHGLGDQRRGDLLAVVVERRVGPGHLERAGSHGAQGHGRLDVHLAAVHAQADRGLLDLLQPGVLAHLREDGVDGVVRRGLDADLPVLALVLVGRREGNRSADDRAAVAAVVDRVRGDRLAVLGGGVVLHGGGEDQRLEGGRRLVVRAQRVVGVVLGVARAAVHRHDVAGLGVHRGGTELGVGVDLALLGVEVVGELVLDGLLQLPAACPCRCRG